MSALKDQITLLKSFLRGRFKITVLCCSIAFLLIWIAGYFIGINSPEVVEEVMSSFFTNAQEQGALKNDGSIAFFPLLANNWRVMMLSVLQGAIPFLFLPAVTLASNAYLIGLAGARFTLKGIPFHLFLASILPHGIFELPAIVLSIACGIHLCISLAKLITRSFKRTPMGETLSDLLRVMLLLVAPMTILAAVIETYITEWFVYFIVMIS